MTAAGPGLAGPLGTVLTTARALAGQLLDWALPPSCPCCATELERDGALCPACWSRLVFHGPPQCDGCAQPFEIDPGPGQRCAGCLAQPHRFDRCRAALVYGGLARDLVLGLKHADRTQWAVVLAPMLARAGRDLLAEADLLVPVPLHPWRLFRRRYNQSALLALALSEISGVPTDPLALERRRPTRSQGGLSRDGRRRNLAGAIRARDEALPRLAGRRIVIIDDVMTTGATLNACALALERAGAAAIDALVLARVP